MQLNLHPEQLLQMPCRWNQRAWAFGEGDTCTEADLSLHRGVAKHGSRGIFLKRSFANYKRKISTSTHHLRTAFFYYLLSMKDDPQWCMQRSVFYDKNIMVDVADRTGTSVVSQSLYGAMSHYFPRQGEGVVLLVTFFLLVLWLVFCQAWRSRTHYGSLAYR